MILAVVVGAFCAATVAVLLRPIFAARHSVAKDTMTDPSAADPSAAGPSAAGPSAAGPFAAGPFAAGHPLRGHAARSSSADEPAPLGLLRQLRDLEDDRASGKVADRDYQRLRRMLERQAADALHPSGGVASRAGTATTGPGTATTGLSTMASQPSSGAIGPRPAVKRRARTRWLRRAVGLVVTVAAAAAVSVLLVNASHERAPGLAAAGNPAGNAAGGSATSQLTEIEDAVARVTANPREVSAHLDLARAYTNAAQPQLATVEYLAAVRLDPKNAEANTALALVAFTSGSAQQAEEMADKALEARPGYPEALYVRGLIRAMGLNHPEQARQDLEAYLRAAPFGSHRTTVETVLALVDGASR